MTTHKIRANVEDKIEISVRGYAGRLTVDLAALNWHFKKAHENTRQRSILANGAVTFAATGASPFEDRRYRLTFNRKDGEIHQKGLLRTEAIKRWRNAVFGDQRKATSIVVRHPQLGPVASWNEDDGIVVQP